jgi:hypothetical protein
MIALAELAHIGVRVESPNVSDLATASARRC